MDSCLYQYSFTSGLPGNILLTANNYYAIEITPTGSSQDIGWAEETGTARPPPANEVGELDPVDGYGRMELDVTTTMGAPEPASWALGLGGCFLFVCLRRCRRSPRLS